MFTEMRNNKLDLIDGLLDKSIKELNENSKAIEKALEDILKQEGIEISKNEYLSISYLTNAMNEIDNLLLNSTTKKTKKKKKLKKRKK